MSRPFRAPALAVIVLCAAAGCQDYNFNPVGHCLIQPGSKRFTLSTVDSADILFVVDDSGSMGGEQERLAEAFDEFVQNLSSTNVSRASQGLEPFGYHVAVTTTSVYWNFDAGQTCRTDCTGTAGQAVCCAGTTPARQPKRCTTLGAGAPECPISGTVCSDTCAGLKGELFCCQSGDPGPIPPGAYTELVPCSRVGSDCGGLQTHYDFNILCRNSAPGGSSPDPDIIGAAENGWPYPHGSFVGRTAVPPVLPADVVNPRVLHFDKRLYKTEPQTNSQGFTRAQLEAFFQQNVRVGVCGSGQEQALQAARLAIQNALDGRQKDTYAYAPVDAAAAPTKTRTWDGTKRIAGSPAAWPNENSKLVVVLVGDEDDCSSPEDPSGGVVMLPEAPGEDACTRDASTDRKQFAVESFADYLTGLGRPVAAGFVFSTSLSSCRGEECTPGICVQAGCTEGAAVCGGQAAGTRLYEAAQQLKGRGIEVVTGSICDNFGPILQDIAEVVKPPQTLTLPTPPAEGDVTLLRIATAGGDTRKLCGRPLAAGAYPTLQAAQATGADWWFTSGVDAAPPVAGVTRYVYINPQGTCRANPGETYSADYLGLVPAPTSDNPLGGCDTNAECTARLGGTEGSFTCWKGAAGDLPRGTCICGGTP